MGWFNSLLTGLTELLSVGEAAPAAPAVAAGEVFERAGARFEVSRASTSTAAMTCALVGGDTAQSGSGELIHVNSAIVDGIKAQVEIVTRGMGGDLAWPALLRKLDRSDSSYRE